MIPTLTKDEWAGVLDFAHVYDAPNLRDLAATHLIHLAPSVDRIVWGREYGLSHWLLDAYVEICTRPTKLSKEEGIRLGIHEMMNIHSVREDLRSQSLSGEDARRLVQKTCMAVCMHEDETCTKDTSFIPDISGSASKLTTTSVSCQPETVDPAILADINYDRVSAPISYSLRLQLIKTSQLAKSTLFIS